MQQVCRLFESIWLLPYYSYAIDALPLQLKLNNSRIAITLNMKRFTLHDAPKHLWIVKISTEVYIEHSQ